MAVSIYCPHCHRLTALRMARYRDRDGTNTSAITNEIEDNVWWIGICNGCNRPVLVHDEGDTIYPHPLPSPSDSNIPDDMRADLDEAKMCFAVNCFRACTVVARRCVQRACISKGARGDKLVDQIQDLTRSGQITKDLEEWVTVVRFIGNDGAHPNVENVTDEEAQDCLKLAEQFLHVLFVTPAIAQARREKKGK